MERFAAMRFLRVFRNYCTNEPLLDPKEFYLDQNAAECVFRQCIDSRQNDKRDLAVPKGRVFLTAAAAAILPRWHGGTGIDIQSRIDMSFPIANAPSLGSVVVAGHTKCGAVTFLNRHIAGLAKDDDSYASAWLMPFATEAVKSAVCAAYKKGKSDDEVAFEISKVIAMQSLLNLMDYLVIDKTVSQHVDDGDVVLYAALRDIVPSTNGVIPFYVFNPDTLEYIEILDLYRSVGSPSFETLTNYDPKAPENRDHLPRSSETCSRLRAGIEKVLSEL